MVETNPRSSCDIREACVWYLGRFFVQTRIEPINVSQRVEPLLFAIMNHQAYGQSHATDNQDRGCKGYDRSAIGTRRGAA